MNLRQRILEASHRAQSGHVPSAFSCLELVDAVCDNMAPEDKFILSKGHAALASYAILEKNGTTLLDDFGNTLGGHPSHLTQGILFSTGSLGHGLALACGVAMAQRITKKPGRVYVLLGDGECQEGSVYEAAAVIAAEKLPITAIIDYNKTHGNPFNMFEALGWQIRSCDGHSLDSIGKAFSSAGTTGGPLAVIARTVKGKGCARMEADPGAWHHRAPNDAEFREMMEELENAN